MEDLEQFFLAEKEVGHFPGWSVPEEEDDYMWFVAPLEIHGIAEVGLVLRGGCLAHQPDCHVSFALGFVKRPGRRHMTVERFDWRSIRGGHTNPIRPKSEWSGKRVSDTHLHDFHLNFDKVNNQMRTKELKAAREISESLDTFSSVRDFIGRRLNITNIHLVSEPDWVYDLFSRGMS